MASKKYKLILGLITLMTSTTFAQTGSGYSIYDSSVIPSKRLPQQNEFLNNTYNFPAKPRNHGKLVFHLETLVLVVMFRQNFLTGFWSTC